MAATVSGAFSGLIAYGVGKSLTLSNTGRQSWSWLFIIEGAMAMGVGIAIWLLLPAFPDKLKHKHWLFTPTEIDLAKERSSCMAIKLIIYFVANRFNPAYNTLGFNISWRQIILTLKEPKAWAFASIYAGIALGVSSLATFLPTFIQAFGYSRGRLIILRCLVLLLTITPYRKDSAVLRHPICLCFHRDSHLHYL
jgi:MFS family permease